MIRNQQKVSSTNIVPGIRLNLNPFEQRSGSARVLRNWTPTFNRLTRKAFAPKFHATADTASGSVWAVKEFNYHRANAPETQLLIFRSDGKVYKATGGSELEIFPGLTGFTALSSRPQPVQIGNFLVWGDTENAFIYDGRSIRAWGLAREPTVLPVVAADTGNITAAGGLSATVTWVVLDEQGNRVHESSRSPVSAFQILSGQGLKVTKTTMGTPPAATTHWSVYMSENNLSAIRLRAATTPIVTDFVVIADLPAATSPIEPIRNDPPPASNIMSTWKNRIAMVDRNDRRRVWFTAFGEVNGLLNGAGAESVSGADSSSVSDIVNEFLFPRQVNCLVEHEDLLFIFTQVQGHVIMGTGGILDAAGNRDLFSGQQFSEGAAGARAAVSTPFGLAWFTPGRQVWLWPGAETKIDIGQDIQTILENIPSASMDSVELHWWDGNGKKWLMMAVDAPAGEDPEGSTAQRLFIYDFSLRSDQQRPGEWFEWADVTTTSIGTYIEGGQRFLLTGDSSGDVYQQDVIADPAHLSRSAILGRTYLGSSIQNNPAATMTTGLIMPSGDLWSTGLYIGLVRGSHDGPSTSIGSNPTVNSAIDPLDPDTTPSIALTLGSADTSGEFRAWLLNEAGGTEGGALARQFQFKLSYAAGSSNNAEADGRTTVALEALYKLSFSWQPQQELAK